MNKYLYLVESITSAIDNIQGDANFVRRIVCANTENNDFRLSGYKKFFHLLIFSVV